MANPATDNPDFIELDLTDAERENAARAALPAWAQTAITALATAPTVAKVGDIIAPIRAQPESPAKETVRKAKDAAVARIRATDRAVLLALVSRVWLTLWGWMGTPLNAGGSEWATSGLPARIEAIRAMAQSAQVPVATPATPSIAPSIVPRTGSRERPYGNATYTRLHSGHWGARISHAVNHQVAEHEFVLVRRKNGSTQLHVITRAQWTDGHTTLVALGDAPPATQRQAIPLVTAPVAESAQEPASNTVESLESAIGNIVAESTGNANVQSAGSLRGGQLRGVGFSTAQGYVTALANGVKAATAEQYKATLRESFQFTAAQIAALTVTIISESTLPVGHGITHVPQGTSFADMTPAERRAVMNQTPAQARAKADVAKQEAKARVMFIAGLVRSGQGLIVSPGEAAHGVSLPAPELRAALAKIGREDIAPRLKSNKAQFGEVMQSLNGNGLKAWAVIRKDVKLSGEEWPADVVSRWIVGTLDGRGQLGSMGDKLLVAELLRDDEIQFAGGSASLRKRVVDAFEVRATEQAYNSTDLLNWFRGVLHTEHHALKNGGFLFVPGTEEQIQPVLDFIDAIKSLLGRSVGLGFAQSHKTMRDGLADSLVLSVTKLGREWQLKKDIAAKRERDKAIAANKSPEEQELAARRAVVLADAAGSSLRDCAKIAETVEGYAAMLGDAAKPARKALAALRAEIEPLCDDSSLRAAMLDLD